jgi:hypothetical protein
MTAIIGIMLLSGIATVVAIRCCPLARAVGFQINQVASGDR